MVLVDKIQEEALTYMSLIYQGTSPTPRLSPEKWERISENEQKAVNETPGVSPGLVLQPADTATTVRVKVRKTRITEVSFVATEDALDGYLLSEADRNNVAIELASRVPAVRMGGAMEARPVTER